MVFIVAQPQRDVDTQSCAHARTFRGNSFIDMELKLRVCHKVNVDIFDRMHIATDCVRAHSKSFNDKNIIKLRIRWKKLWLICDFIFVPNLFSIVEINMEISGNGKSKFKI